MVVGLFLGAAAGIGTPIDRRNGGRVHQPGTKRIIVEENPLHPFELHNLVPISLGGLDISINKAVIMMWVVVALVTVLMVMAGSARRLVPGKLQNLGEILVEFIRAMILDTMGKDGMKFFPLIATLFLFILFCDWLGLIPGTYTVTSQIIVTGVFAVRSTH